MRGCLKLFAILLGIAVVIFILGALGASFTPTTEAEPPMDDFAVKNSATEVTYEMLMRNAEAYEGRAVMFKGNVVQTGEAWGSGWIRVLIDAEGYSSDAVYVEWDHNNKILEDDHVQVFGVGDGRVQYKTVLGAQVSAPAVDATSVTLVP